MKRKRVTKRLFFFAAFASMLFWVVFTGTTLAKDSSSNTVQSSIPTTKFTPEVSNQYKNKEGYLVTEYTQPPNKYVTDSKGNILSESEVAPASACSPRYYFETISSTRVKTDSFISYHPSFKSWDKVDGYWFGSASQSFSVGLSGYGVDVSVSVAGPGFGTFITANPDVWSRPRIYGNVNRVKQKVKVQNPCGADETYTQNVYRTNSTYNKAVYQ